jgi:hypothetical protein
MQDFDELILTAKGLQRKSPHSALANKKRNEPLFFLIGESPTISTLYTIIKKPQYVLFALRFFIAYRLCFTH